MYRKIAAAGFLLVGIMTATECEASDDLLSFVSTYQCSVAGLIARIHAHRGGDDRYLILAPWNDRGSYVQCLLGDHDRQALCEAASGWWAGRGQAPMLGPAQKGALARLGYSMDASRGNYQKRLRFGSELDMEGVADLMLRSLYAGYGVRLENTIEVQAPYAFRHGTLPRDRCPAIS